MKKKLFLLAFLSTATHAGSFHPWASDPSHGPYHRVVAPPASTAFRELNPTGDMNLLQLSAAEEKKQTQTPATHRWIPDITKDDQGDITGSILYANRAQRPDTICGMTQNTIAARIAECAVLNPLTATWDGTRLGGGAETVWKLVTKTGTGAGVGYEVWADLRTGLLWSGLLGTTNWCRASGNAQADDPANYCNNPTYQNQTNPESWCVEGVDGTGRTLNTPATYDEMKGNMRRTATTTSPSVIWRLPSMSDINQAIIDGLPRILPASAGASNYIYTSTVTSSDAGRTRAFWYYKTSSWIYTSYYNRTSALGVHCIGTSNWNPAAEF